MDSRQLVYAAIECRSPTRFVYRVGLDRSVFDDHFTAEQMAELDEHLARVPEDFVDVDVDGGRRYIDTRGEHGHANFLDDWGCEWTGALPRLISHPIGAGWELLDSFTPPAPPTTERIERARAVVDTARAADRYVLGSVWFTLFERMWSLRGFENLLMDAYLHPREFERLQEMVLDVQLAKIRALGEAGVDGIIFTDDWGTQEGLIISPQDWRRFYRAAYKRLFDAAHDVADHIWMHLCGNIAELIPELVDLGLDVLNPIQPRALDVDRLGREWRGKLCFYGGIDVQGTLPFGTPDEIRREIDWLIETLSASSGGGYIVGTSHSIGPETPFENLVAMFEYLDELRGG